MKFIFAKSLLLPLVSLLLAQFAVAASLEAKLDEIRGTITIHRAGLAKPVVTQNAASDHRPYLHPITGPDGKGVFTQYIQGITSTKQVFIGDSPVSMAEIFSTIPREITGIARTLG